MKCNVERVYFSNFSGDLIFVKNEFSKKESEKIRRGSFSTRFHGGIITCSLNICSYHHMQVHCFTILNVKNADFYDYEKMDASGRLENSQLDCVRLRFVRDLQEYSFNRFRRFDIFFGWNGLVMLYNSRSCLS